MSKSISTPNTLEESLQELDRIVAIYKHRSQRFRAKCTILVKDIGEFNEHIRQATGTKEGNNI